MIQRIQSVLLLLASGSCFSLFGLPFATSSGDVGDSVLFAQDNTYNIQDDMLLLAPFVLGGLLALGAIFLYNNRKLQTTVSRVAAVAMLIGIVVSVLFFTQDMKLQTEALEVSDSFGLYTPILGFILTLAAGHYIQKDEKLVRNSYDRLR